MAGPGDDEVFHGRQGGDPEYPLGWLDGLPTSGRDQSCAICGNQAVAWVHRLDPDDARFRLWGKGHTLPTFWTLCRSCEDRHDAADHAGLAEVMRASPSWSDPDGDDDERIQGALGAFVRADRGRRALTD
jgi:hypothetical protein